MTGILYTQVIVNEEEIKHYVDAISHVLTWITFELQQIGFVIMVHNTLIIITSSVNSGGIKSSNKIICIWNIILLPKLEHLLSIPTSLTVNYFSFNFN